METVDILGIPERKVRAVTPLSDYRLLLEFDNGEKLVYDVTPLLKFSAFASLKDEAVFRQVQIVFDRTIGWSGDIEICANCLYEHSTPI